MDQSNSLALAADITKSASKQTYYTIRFFVDTQLKLDAFRAYGYFRWVDDTIDLRSKTDVLTNDLDSSGKLAFVNRQKDLLEACYRGEYPEDLSPEEQILADLVRNDSGMHPGLKSYLDNMMSVMAFDVRRRSRVITEAELTEYTHALSTAVTDALFYFIGHNDGPPLHHGRYSAVTAAHITHMLRDTLEDIKTGYFNIPGEFLVEHGITPSEVESQAYREWICSQVSLARRYFKEGRDFLAQVKNLRCRIAGYAYTARFEWMLRLIERDHYHLCSKYPTRKSLWAGLWMSWMTLTSLFTYAFNKRNTQFLAFQPSKTDKS